MSSRMQAGDVRVSAHTDVGRVRKVNEDGYLARRPVFAVADGMGGHARGDAASRTAVEALARELPGAEDGARPSPDAVLAAVRTANTEVRALSGADEVGLAVAGTTLAAVVEVEADGRPCWMVVNVGDSRVYSWDGRTLSQITVDHSAVQEMLDAGLIGADEAADHPDRNIITRALGASDHVEIDSWLIPAGGRQGFVICSDGLCKELDDEAVADVLARSAGDEGEPAVSLVEAAVAAGGRDNVTVVVVESQAGEAEQDDPEQTADRRDGAAGLFEDTRPRPRGGAEQTSV